MGEESITYDDFAVDRDVPEGSDRDQKGEYVQDEADSSDMTENPGEELSDSEYAELIGEEIMTEEDGEQPEEPGDAVKPYCDRAQDKEKSRHKRKRRREPIEVTQQGEEGKPKRRKVHAVGGTDTLTLHSAQVSGTLLPEGFYKDCTILPSSEHKGAYDSRKDPKDEIRKFTLHHQSSLIRDLERGGRSFTRAVRSFSTGQETAEKAGERNLRKYMGASVDVADLLAVFGGKAVADIQKTRSRQLSEGAVHAEQAIRAGKLKRSDLLLPAKELKAKIRKAGLKPYEYWGIAKHRRDIHDALVTKEVLLKVKDESPDQKHVFARTKVLGRNVVGISAYESRKQVGILTSEAGKLYNDFKYNAWTRNMIRTYFASQPDPMLQKLNPAGMSVRELKALLSRPEHYHLKPEQVSVLRVLIMGKRAQKARAMDKYLTGLGGAFRSVKALVVKGVRIFERVDDVSTEGYRKLATIYHGIRTVKPMVKLAGTAGISSVRLVGNLPPVAYVRHQTARQIRKGAKAVSSAAAAQGKQIGNHLNKAIQTVRRNAGGRVKTVAEASKGTRAAVKAAAKGSGTVRSATLNGMRHAGTTPLLKTAGSTVKSIGKTTEAVRKGFRKVRKSRAARTIGFIGRRLSDAGYVVTAPMRITLSAFAHIRIAIRKVIAVLLAVIFAVLLIFLFLIMFSAFITTVGNSTGEIIGGVVTDDALAEHIRHLNERNAEKFQEAVNLAKEPPRHDTDRIDAQGLYPDEAYHGVHLYHYGSPRTPSSPDANIYHNDISGTPPAGYHYYYIDSDGQTIANHTANTKDIICLTSVMVGNDYDEEVLSLAQELMDIWFDYLNPAPSYTVSPLYHKEGTDRFPYDGYTFNGQTWYCTDVSFYAAFQAAEADHVHFYERPREYSEKGCKTNWDAYDADRDARWELRPEYPEYPDRDDYEDEEWEEALEDYYGAMDAYWEARSEWNSARPDVSDYRYCPGHEALSCSYGYRDINIYVTVLTKEDVYRAASNGNVLTYRVPRNYSGSEWEERSVILNIPVAYADVTGQFVRDGGWSNPKHQEWCDRLYGGDWYSMYGVDTYSDSVSLPTGEGALSEEQIAEMIGRIGNVSEARAEIIGFALDYVGRIPYYWGGKASVSGFEGNHFGSIVETDYKGRTRKGLDCSGFVGWVYWSVIGVKPSLDLFIKALKPGDTIYIHPEAEYHPSTTIQRISEAGLIPGISLNPGTSVEEVRMLLRIVPKVLVMSVNPGNAAQLFLPYVGEKYEQLLRMKEEVKFDVYWDGACGADKIQKYAPMGVRGFVLGTTLLFGKNKPYAETLADIRRMRF